MSTESIVSAGPVDVVDRRLSTAQVLALVAHRLREAGHKWILVALFALTTLFLLALATVVNVDVVEGTIASAKLFGTMELPLEGQSIEISEAVAVIQTIIVFVLSTFGLLLALFVSGSIIPRTLTPGWVDLLASQPISRPALILGRVLGAIAVVGLSLAYLFGGSWLILTWKTGFGNAGFLVAGVLILFAYLSIYSGMVLVGVVTRSSPVSIIAGIGIWFVGWILSVMHTYPEWTTAFRLGWPRTLARWTTESLYWVLPKAAEVTNAATHAARLESFDLTPVLTSIPFAIVCVAMACWWFLRQDY